MQQNLVSARPEAFFARAESGCWTVRHSLDIRQKMKIGPSDSKIGLDQPKNPILYQFY
jgi:hypothetical protein